MKVILRQKSPSVTESYTVTDEKGDPLFELRSDFFALSPTYELIDTSENIRGCIKQRSMTIDRIYDIFCDGIPMGCAERTKGKPGRNTFSFAYNGWTAEGDIAGLEFRVYENGFCVVEISRKLDSLSDTYVINIANDPDLMPSVMFAAAIDLTVSEKL